MYTQLIDFNKLLLPSHLRQTIHLIFVKMASIEALAIVRVDCDKVAINIDALDQNVPPHLLGDGEDHNICSNLRGSEGALKPWLIVWTKAICQAVRTKIDQLFRRRRR